MKKPSESATGIIPGNRGKVGGNWCRSPLCGASRGRHISPVPLDGVAAAPVYATKELCGEARLRNRVRTGSGSRSVSDLELMQLPRGFRLLLYDQDAAQCSGGSTPPKGRLTRLDAKRNRRSGEWASLAKLAKPPPWGGPVKRDHPTANRTQPER